MRCILPLLALAACAPPPARSPAPGSSGSPATSPGQPLPPSDAADAVALVPHLAPGDPVVVAIRFPPDRAAATVESLEVSLARPDGTTQRAAPRPAGSPASAVDLTAGGGLDLSLAGRYRISLSGLAGGRRFRTGELEIEVVADGRLPLAEIERRARLELARRRPGVTPAPDAVVSEEPGGDRTVRFHTRDAVHVVRLTPAGAVRGVETGPAP
ncbi:MAG TPA: hypothetical protein VFU21_31690 [Kofleriaceae bacterium]|nr:hypothetical protein [Kofleriaceae bacterium]